MYISLRDDQEKEMLLIKKAKKILKGGRASSVSKATGWSSSKVKSEMKKAKALGISNFNYVTKAAYELSDEELKEMGDTLKLLKKSRAKDEKFYADIVQLRTGWDRDKIAKKMAAAKRIGISNYKYAQQGCWLRSDEDLKKLSVTLAEEEQVMESKKPEYVSRIMERTGWSRGKTELEIAKERLRLGSSYEDFCRFGFDGMTLDERLKYPTLRLMSKFRLRHCSYVPRATYFDDKAEFNRTFADYVHRVWFTNKDLTYDEFVDKIKDVDYLMIKPITNSCGIGISKHKCNVSDEENRKIYDLLMSEPDTFAEECIVQHEDMMKLCPTSVNTIRINTMWWQGECIFQFAIVRTGCGGIIDNFHNGGIAARVDIETGIVNADAVDLDGNLFPQNPYSGVTFRGYQIPNWDKVIEVTKAITPIIKDMDYVGWDFAITPDGVDLIEGNEGAYVMPQICNLQDKRGLRPLLVDPYFTENEI